MSLKAPRLFRTTAFRFGLLYLALFGASAAVLFGFIYWSTAGLSESQVDATIETEIRALAEQFEQGGTMGLVGALDRRTAVSRATRGLYLLTDADFKPIVGNLSRWPDAKPDADGWVSFQLEYDTDEGVRVEFGRARVFRLRGPLYLLVGRDVRERRRTVALIREAMGWGIAITIALALAGAILMSRGMLRQVDAISASARRIMTGDMSERLPLSGTGDEFDQLARQLNEMLNQIERLMAAMEQVTNNIAHDLRTPLARLRNRLDGALRTAEGDASYRDTLHDALNEADQLLRTFNALLSIAQAEAGTARERFAEVDLAPLLRDVVELYEPLAEEREITLGTDFGHTACVTGERNLLFQAVANLLDNAIKFSAVGGAVSLSLRARADGSELIVTDAGPGIPADARDDVVKPFVRLDASRNAPGNGLGLPLVAAVAALHGGALTLDDNEPGLRAVISLPAPQTD